MPSTDLSDGSPATERKLTMVLVFVYPTIALLRLYHQLIVTKTSVDEGVDKGTSEITPR